MFLLAGTYFNMKNRKVRKQVFEGKVSVCYDLEGWFVKDFLDQKELILRWDGRNASLHILEETFIIFRI